MKDDQVYENVWNGINVGRKTSKGGSEGYQITQTSVSSNWYRKQIDTSGVRKMKLQRYYEMDESSVEISRALDILAEDISSCNADNEDPFELAYDENKKFLKSTIKLIESAKDLWVERTGMDFELFNRVRETLKYGSCFFIPKPDGRLKRIPHEQLVGYILDEEDNDVVTHYIVDPTATLMDHQNKKTYSAESIQMGSKEQKSNFDVYPVDELCIMKIGSGPFGESVLDSVFKVWKQMTLIEDAVVIYRVVRAPERRIYYIDVGNLQGPKREQAIEKQRLRLMQKQVNRKNQLTSDYDPHSTSEDIFIPTNATGKGSRVETLQGGQNLGELDDLQYFVRKMAAGLRIPSSMIDTHTQEKEQNSDMRVGQMYQIELRYLGHVKRMARGIAKTLHENFATFCRKRSVEVPEGIILKLNDPNSYSKYRDMEIYQQTLNLAASTSQLPSLSKKYMMEKYMLMDKEELQKNEELKLIEKGLAPDIIKGMPQEDIDNLVYGDGSAGKRYGIEPAEDQAGFGRF